ncbi:hypothetical protein DFA_01216 [Cavenderia fasciculata]|uniref:Uncharacterized protein n=1 Tax=Cavenderia fasciculata TaxID=261658 RepID=F4PRJ5_CACFS|nr:uncharacterized protein DFA_01216 [Cavenderia fasciculata]EGG21335.1 hypothetical protein DFA_01216 [Cavenderia fasciculata]|eukprot:XP_004359185.1 hypothetical protein DFA_01216 [Cavenderia fasciculata]
MEPAVTERSIEPYKSDMYDHITIVNTLEQSVVVFMNSESPPIKINKDLSTTIFQSAVQQIVEPGNSANFELPLDNEKAYIHVFVAVQVNENEGRDPSQYIQIAKKYLLVDTRFNVLPKHLTSALGITDKPLFNRNFHLLVDGSQTSAEESVLDTLNEYSTPYGDEETRVF